MELNATLGIRYGHFSSVDGGGGGGSGHDSLRDKAEIFWQMMVAVRGGEIMTWLYCTSVHHQKDQSHKSIMFSTPVITTSAHKHWLSLPIQWADERRMQMLEMRRLRSERTMFPYSRLRRYLSLSPPCVMYGVRTCMDRCSLLDLKNIDVGGINLNTEAILVSGLLIVLLWRTDFILIWKEFVILYLIHVRNLKLETGTEPTIPSSWRIYWFWWPRQGRPRYRYR